MSDMQDSAPQSGHPIVGEINQLQQDPADGHVYLVFRADIKFSVNGGGLFGHVDIANFHMSRYIRLPDAVKLIEALDPGLATPKSVVNWRGVVVGVGLTNTEGSQKPMQPTQIVDMQ